MDIRVASPPSTLEARLAQGVPHAPVAALRALCQAGFDRLPLPGRGATLARWRALAVVAAHDLALAKLYEGHVDALAILADLGGSATPGLWGVWAAESPQAKLRVLTTGNAGMRLRGRKSWCSGAVGLDHALVTAWDEDDRPRLAAVDLRAEGVRVTQEGWCAVGMAASGSVDVVFDDASCRLVGSGGAYLERPGFWQGGAGVAACWHGGASALAARLHEHAGRTGDPHALAHLGAVDAGLGAAAALLRDSAHWIDAHPAADARAVTLRARATVDAACAETVSHVTRGLGAGPLCRDAWVARRVADLPVFVRQCHAERDLAALGSALIANGASPRSGGWQL